MINVEKLIDLADNLPEGYKGNALNLLQRMGETVEGIGDEPIVWKPSLLRMVQGTTDRSSIPKGSAIGDFILGEERVDRPLKMIPLLIWDGRQYWSPDQNEAKMLCNSPDAKLGYIGAYCNQCPHSKWDETANRADCGKIKQAICIKEDFSDIFIISFAKTNYTVGMDFMNLMKKAGVAPYRRVYAVDSQTNTKHKNVENFSVKPADDKATKAELLEFLAELFKAVQSDRKASVDKFYEIVLARRDSQPALSAPAADSTILIEDGTVVDASGEPAGEVSSLAKNYVV